MRKIGWVLVTPINGNNAHLQFYVSNLSRITDTFSIASALDIFKHHIHEDIHFLSHFILFRFILVFISPFLFLYIRFIFLSICILLLKKETLSNMAQNVLVIFFIFLQGWLCNGIKTLHILAWIAFKSSRKYFVYLIWIKTRPQSLLAR